MTTQPTTPDRGSSDDLGADPQRRRSSAPSKALADTAAFAASADARQTQDHVPGSPLAAEFELAGPQVVLSTDIPKSFGRYRIESRLGRGGMGSVFLAHDTQLERPVALKVPRLALDTTGTLVERFMREARAAATLSHPNICPIFDVGELGGVHFIAMGYVEGRPLTAYIESGKSQPERQVAIVVRKVALAIDEAHRHGIVHRDLKPANIMIDRRGEPIVMDFGLACRVDNTEGTRLTQDGILLGTPAYMAPEQIDHRVAVGPAADIYSLGVVLYELLTGRCPFDGSVVSVIGQALHTEPPPLASLRADISLELAGICGHAMAKNPQDRFASMKDFAVALTGFLKGERASDAGTALRMTSTQPMTPAVENATSPQVAPLERFEDLVAESLPAASVSPVRSIRPYGAAAAARRRNWLIAGSGIAAAVVAGVLLAVTLRGSASSDAHHEAETPATSKANEPTAARASTSRSAASADDGGDDWRKTLASAPAATPTAAKTDSVALPAVPPVVPALPATTSPPPAPASSPVPIESKATSVPAAAPASASRFGFSSDPNQSSAERTPLGEDELREQFHQADRNGDGKLDPTEIPLHIILRADKGHNRVLTLAEVESTYRRLGEKMFDPPTAEEQRKASIEPPVRTRVVRPSQPSSSRSNPPPAGQPPQFRPPPGPPPGPPRPR